ncbi:MAG: Ig-like domain-containing protein [Chitinophagaceae bacterium]|nr:Ig-like domain-containing protein [Chitinophagaceae bacterium]
MRRIVSSIIVGCCIFVACGKGGDPAPPPPPPAPVNFGISSWTVNGVPGQTINYNVPRNAPIRFQFGAAINRATVASNIRFQDNSAVAINATVSYSNGDSVIILQPTSPLNYLSRYHVTVTDQLKSTTGGRLVTGTDLTLTTIIDSSRKFPIITDNELLELVQKQTFKYFWDFGHPVSGLARERNTSGETITSGGSGFGMMSIVTGISRGFITRPQGLTRLQTMVSFLKNTAQKFHGAFPHWLNGSTGVAIPFSTKDNGADLVETSYLMMGLLTARQYFNTADPAEVTLRNDINSIWNGVEWNWFRQNNQNVLYWHWSPNYNWEMNHPIRGWNECLITYVLAASSTTFSIPPIVYTAGWAGNGTNGFINGGSYYGIPLPLGPAYGGPLFFEHYSFMGIKPTGLSDAYANYQTQTTNHTRINYEHSRANPANHFGYSDSVWGLTASDIPNGYAASSPTNDIGVIAPTAALSSFPYTPIESMKALKFFYYVLGDKLWGQYGFKDAFSLKDIWFADSYLAIDQGPIIVMIENYRTGLLWNLFTSCPEVKAGMLSLGFTAPYL